VRRHLFADGWQRHARHRVQVAACWRPCWVVFLCPCMDTECRAWTTAGWAWERGEVTPVPHRMGWAVAGVGWIRGPRCAHGPRQPGAGSCDGGGCGRARITPATLDACAQHRSCVLLLCQLWAPTAAPRRSERESRYYHMTPQPPHPTPLACSAQSCARPLDKRSPHYSVPCVSVRAPRALACPQHTLATLQQMRRYVKSARRGEAKQKGILVSRGLWTLQALRAWGPKEAAAVPGDHSSCRSLPAVQSYASTRLVDP